MTLSLIMKAATLGGVALAGAATADAGEWRLNPNLCPDLIEDRIDRSVTTGARDIREDVRDARRVNCPASAWYYVPGPRERVRANIRYTGPRVVFAGRRGFYTYSPRRRAYRPVRVNIRF